MIDDIKDSWHLLIADSRQTVTFKVKKSSSYQIALLYINYKISVWL